MKSYRPVVAAILQEHRPASILDVPTGSGWPPGMVEFRVDIDDVNLFRSRPTGYREFHEFNLKMGLPTALRGYHAIACCEGLEHLGNPALFFDAAH